MSKLTNLLNRINTLVATNETIIGGRFSVNRKEKVTAFTFTYKDITIKVRERIADTFIVADLDGARAHVLIPTTAALMGYDSIERAVKYGEFDEAIAELVEELRNRTANTSFFTDAVKGADVVRDLAVRPVNDNWVSELPKAKTALDRLKAETKEEEEEIF